MTKRIQEICRLIYDAIEEKISIDVPEEVLGKMSKLQVLLASSAELLANVKKEYGKRELIALDKIDPKLSPSIMKKRLDAQMAEEQYWLTFADRLNSGLVHSIDALRSNISYLKEELNKSI